VKADGSDYRILPLDSSGLNLEPGAWSPDDNRIALEGWDDGDPSRNGIYIADATGGGNRHRVTTTMQRDIPISYSPDGSKILFRRGPQDCGATGDLFVVGVDGGGLTQVNAPDTMVFCNLSGPGDWSPNGTEVSFAAFAANSSVSGRSAVFVAGLNGTRTTQITEWGADTSSAHWSPAGDWIVFDRAISGSPPSHGIFLVHPDGSGLKAIPLAAGGCCAAWSPAGDRLLFRAGPADQELDLWIVRIDGSHLAQVTSTPANLADVSWSGPTG
jgi:Tol biopolymer transport system component